MGLKTVFLIGVGGFFGANLRYLFSLLIPRLVNPDYPQAGTLFVNVVGSLGLAIFLAWTAKQTSLSPDVRLFLATGFFGSYTTFSTFANEALTLGQSGGWRGALAYVLITNMLCIVGAFIGLWIGNRI